MLWWDDNPAKSWGQKKNSVSQIPENGEILEKCYRNTGSVPVPRKISAPQPQSPLPKPSRKVSCPVIQRPPPKPEPNLLRALDQQCIFEEGRLSDLLLSDGANDGCVKAKSCVQSASGASLFAKVTHKPKLLTASEKAQTMEAEMKKELKRGSMKEKWGLSLVYRLDGSRICLSAKKVSMFSAAAKAGIGAGDTLVTINDWNIEAMDNIQAVISVFLAAGFSVIIGWSKTNVDPAQEGWLPLDNI